MSGFGILDDVTDGDEYEDDSLSYIAPSNPLAQKRESVSVSLLPHGEE